MSQDYTILIGTVGQGVNVSADAGGSWIKIREPIPGEATIRALAVYPDNPHRILAGSDGGVFRSDDNGGSWDRLDSPFEDRQIWSLTVDPADPETIFVGTRPEGFRSRDGGKNWTHLEMGVDMNCPVGTPRTTNMIVDPRDSRTIWAGIEVDGVYKSLDGGDNWLHMPDLGDDPFHGDIHGMILKPGANSAVYCTSPFGIATSTDEGESWDYHYFPKFSENDRRSYCRGVLLKADNPEVMFVGNGDSIPGETGALQRSNNGGQSWEPVNLPQTPNSVIYWMGTHRDRPDVIVAASLFGYVYASEDGGDSWKKLPREFGEIRSVAVVPN